MIELYLFLGAVVIGLGWEKLDGNTNPLVNLVFGILLWPVVAGCILAEKDGEKK